jgi:methyltransferase-like protein 6
MFDPERVSTLQWDVSEEPLNETLDMKHEIVLSIFALSAVHPDKHRKSFENMAAAMKDGAYLLFRDYGIHDMTMYRHRVRLGQSLFLRNDNTISYYFDLASLAQTVELAGLQVIELSYACVYNKNRKTGDVMRRVFVHGVFIKLPAEA